MTYKTAKLENWQWAKEIRLKHYKKLMSARENGIPIVAGSGHGPWSVIAGIGDFAALCGEPWSGSTGFYPDLSLACAEAAEARGYGRDVCGYMKLYLGSMFLNKGPFGEFPKPDLIFQSLDCDLEPHWYNIVGKELNVPVYFVEIGTDFNHLKPREASIQYLVDGYMRGIEWLEQKTGKRYSDELLVQAVTNNWESRRLWTEVCEMQKAVPAPLDIKSMFTLFVPAEINPHESESVAFYKALKDEVKHRVDNQIAAVPNERCRIIHDSVPPWYALHIFRYMEEYGVVAIGGSYVFTLSGSWVEAEDGHLKPMTSIPGVHIPPRTREEAVRIQAWIDMSVVRPVSSLDSAIFIWKSLCKDWKCQGAVFHINRGCILMGYGMMEGSRALRADGIPTMVYEASHVDKREWNESDVRDRIDSFMESLGLKRAALT